MTLQLKGFGTRKVLTDQELPLVTGGNFYQQCVSLIINHEKRNSKKKFETKLNFFS